MIKYKESVWRHATALPPESGPFRIKFGMRGRFPLPRKKVLRVLQVL